MAIQRGEVYFIDLDPATGREQRGRRPVVVVSRDEINSLPLVVAVVPGTGGARVKTDYPQNARVAAGEANLPDETVFLGFQVRAVDQQRFVAPPCGSLSPAALEKVEQALIWSLALPAGPAPSAPSASP
jgi:mRNA interferase MazF